MIIVYRQVMINYPIAVFDLWDPLLLSLINFNLSMDK